VTLMLNQDFGDIVEIILIIVLYNIFDINNCNVPTYSHHQTLLLYTLSPVIKSHLTDQHFQMRKGSSILNITTINVGFINKVILSSNNIISKSINFFENIFYTVCSQNKNKTFFKKIIFFNIFYIVIIC